MKHLVRQGIMLTLKHNFDVHPFEIVLTIFYFTFFFFGDDQSSYYKLGSEWVIWVDAPGLPPPFRNSYLHGTTLTHISISFPRKGVIPPGVKDGDVLQDSIPFGNGRVIIPIPNSASNDFSSWKGEVIDGRIKLTIPCVKPIIFSEENEQEKVL